ncbi:hypothetical protein DER46DRAFT_638543 [Fusarium sp. MPI-SDFR-AT-0072]|nr:hypothetical protein DER46DRAFT_638543 [Fusarium sp. MPI-SDFR-AT-0072]
MPHLLSKILRRSSSPLSDEIQRIDYLPGYPTVGLEAASVHKFLAGELNTPVLDQLHWMLWLFSIKSGHNIDPIHRQRIKGREIVPTEEPKLHLVWTSSRIYIKTLPICLLNHTVPLIAVPAAFDRRVALGFLRSYALLIKSPLDFMFAKEAHLIPDEFEMDWTRWAKFVAHFRAIEDSQVSNRYQFGQLRLNRLNWAVRLVQPSTGRGWYYQRQCWSIGELFRGSFNILLFIFASLSLTLSSMQVVLSIPNDGLPFSGLDAQSSEYLNRAFWVFSMMNIIGSGLTWVVLMLVPVIVFLVQIF